MTLSGVVDDDPRAKVRVLMVLYAVLLPLSSLPALVIHRPGWALVVAGRMLFCALALAWLSRCQALTYRQTVLFVGVFPALSFVSSAAYGVSGSDVRVAWAVFFAALGAVMWGRQVATTAAGFQLTALGVVDFATDELADALFSVTGYIIGFTAIILLVNGTAVRLRATVRDLQAAQAERDRIQQSADEAGERERAKIATELHDDTIQVMTAASLKLDVIRMRPEPSGGKPDLGEALDLMQEAIARARRLSFDLYPPLLDEGLAPALEELVERIQLDAAFVVVLDVSSRRYPPDCERLVYRTARELLENVRKHAGAALVEVSVGTSGADVLLTVADDGRGFDPDRVCNNPDGEFHFGLRAAQERVRRSGGALKVDSAPGQGCRIGVWLPVAAFAAHESS